MTNSLVIYGASGQARVVIDLAHSQGFKIEYIIDEMNLIDSKCYFGIKVVKKIIDIKKIYNHSYSIAVGDNYIRRNIYNKIKKMFGDLHYPVISHTTSHISKSAKIGQGTVIMPLSVIGSYTSVENFCIINTKAAIDHDCLMEKFSSLGPGVVIGGGVNIGTGTAICIGSVVKNHINISSNCVLGANSFLNKNLPKNVVAYGTPAIIIRSRKNNDKYLD
jgi:sugar O-acyltransferase (sialic acid O-acetyltransferase NeuD family)